MNKYNQKKFFNNLLKHLNSDESQLNIWIGYYKFYLIDVHGVSIGNTEIQIKDYLSIHHKLNHDYDPEEIENTIKDHITKYLLLVK